MERTLLLFRALFLTGCFAAGWYISRVIQWTEQPWQAIQWAKRPWLGSCLFMAFGLFVILIDRLMRGVSLRAFSSATLGLTLGCVLSTLILASDILHYVDPDVQWFVRLTVYLMFGYLGTMLALRSNRDEFSLLIPYIRFSRQQPHEQVSLLDTSSIIDGRISDLCKSGFLDGTLVVPQFVLDELQNLADHADANRRVRGRHGLDLLNDLKNSPAVEVKIHHTVESHEPVDAQLIRLGRLLDARIITTDYNLSRVAELQKLRVLNIHLLANAIRPPLLTGETVRIKLLREGKEPHQTVGFLQDGTMIVVNHSQHLMGQEAEVIVSGTIQTSAGRMVFADLWRGPAHPPSKVQNK